MTSNTLRKFIVAGVLLGAGTLVYVRYQETRPCVATITYHVGTFDQNFGISKANFITDLQSAAALWNKAVGKELLQYSDSAGIPVDLVYVTRQATANLGVAIDKAQAAYEADRTRVEAEKAAYDAADTTYESQVTYWNERGGAPPSEYQQLQATRASLDAQLATLNADIAALNAEARATNANVKTYNTNSGAFEEGEYRSNSSGESISLYEFTNKTQLIRLAAHEFGHAIGLGHVENIDSIMYPLNKSTALTLSAEDLAALNPQRQPVERPQGTVVFR